MLKKSKTKTKAYRAQTVGRYEVKIEENVNEKREVLAIFSSYCRSPCKFNIIKSEFINDIENLGDLYNRMKIK